ncbi:glycosyltransferase [Candidatus Pelagibacter bacterium nBUS_49]|uniref:glycosyltransferase n=1 Tax=Candidatus Pelagibacter bacterium nBUS_49 TaxID=3374196 RepID=UPI003EB87D0A
MSKNKTCVILPCYKVKHKIYQVYKKLIKLKIDKLIFVDDCCPENSVRYLKSKVREQKKIQFVYLNENNGVGGATLKGFNIAKNQGFDILLKFDADNQHRTIDLKKIIKTLKNDKVLFCKGFRKLNLSSSRKRKMPFIRIFGTNALTIISRLTTQNYYLKDVTNGLFGLKSNIFSKLNLKKIKKNYFFEQDLIFQLCKKKIKIYQVNSEVLYQNETSSLRILKIIIPFTAYHLQNIFSRNEH